MTKFSGNMAQFFAYFCQYFRVYIELIAYKPVEKWRHETKSAITDRAT